MTPEQDLQKGEQERRTGMQMEQHRLRRLSTVLTGSGSPPRLDVTENCLRFFAHTRTCRAAHT